MSTYGSSTNPPTYGTNPKPESNRNEIIAVLLTILLLIFLAYKWSSSSDENVELTKKLEYCEEQYQVALGEADYLRQKNEELEARIAGVPPRLPE